MSGHDADEDDADFDPERFEALMDGIAESEGISRKEALERLISSYWTVKEIFQLLEGSDPSAASRLEGGSRESFPDDIDFAEPAGTDPDPSADEHPSELRRTVDALKERVDVLATEAGDSPSKEEFAALVDEFEAFRTKVESRHEEIRDRIEKEFSDLRPILEHLIEATEENEGRIDRLAEGHKPGTIERLRAERDAVADLKRTANRLGIRAATCGNCGTDVDLALLETPSCPQCDRTFEGIDPGGWFGLGSDTLTAVDNPPAGLDEG